MSRLCYAGACHRCVFWTGFADYVEPIGQCRRHSPIRQGGRSVWPITDATDWCGDFQLSVERQAQDDSEEDEF